MRIVKKTSFYGERINMRITKKWSFSRERGITHWGYAHRAVWGRGVVGSSLQQIRDSFAGQPCALPVSQRRAWWMMTWWLGLLRLKMSRDLLLLLYEVTSLNKTVTYCKRVAIIFARGWCRMRLIWQDGMMTSPDFGTHWMRNHTQQNTGKRLLRECHRVSLYDDRAMAREMLLCFGKLGAGIASKLSFTSFIFFWTKPKIILAWLLLAPIVKKINIQVLTYLILSRSISSVLLADADEIRVSE